jgi:hypothetical protein
MPASCSNPSHTDVPIPEHLPEGFLCHPGCDARERDVLAVLLTTDDADLDPER